MSEPKPTSSLVRMWLERGNVRIDVSHCQDGNLIIGGPGPYHHDLVGSDCLLKIRVNDILYTHPIRIKSVSGMEVFFEQTGATESTVSAHAANIRVKSIAYYPSGCAEATKEVSK